MEQHFVELDSLQFHPFNYRRACTFALTPANIFGMAFGLFMLSCPMMGWIDYNSPTLGSMLCFGGVCEYLCGFYNWHEGRGVQSFIDFVYGLLFLTIYYTTELGKYSIPIPYEYHTYMQGVFYILWLTMLIVLVMVAYTRGIMYLFNFLLLFFGCLFALVWHFCKDTWARKTSGYFIFIASIFLWLTGLFHLLNGVLRRHAIPCVEPKL